MELNLVQVIAIYAIPVILAITLHEAAHGYIAMRFGDMTAHAAGRVTLNPIKHIDPIGTVALPLVLLAVAKLVGGSGILFGWAKPVPVDFANLSHRKKGMFWVAAAGPLSNLAMAIGWAIVAKLSLAVPQSYFALPLALTGAAGVFVNVIFMVLNLMPLPPLDGGRILVGLLPYRQAAMVARLEPWGFFIVLALVLVGIVGQYWLWPLVSGAVWMVERGFSIPLVELIRIARTS